MWPIVERELRVAARQRRTYWIRSVAALAVIIIWLILTLSVQRSAFLPQIGKLLFNAVGILALSFCLLAGIFLTADCLSSEKREGTLGFLFLTDLKGFHVVLGKLAATSLHSIYALLAILPVMGLSLLLGGVTGGAFGRMILVLLATLFLSLTVGLFASAIRVEAREAMGLAFVIMLVLAGMLPALWWLQKIVFRVTFVDHVLLLPSAGFAFLKALDSGFASASGRMDFWLSLLTMTGMGTTLLVTTGAILPRVWQDGKTLRWKLRRKQVGRTFHRDPRRRKLRSLLEQNPFYWLVSRSAALKSGPGIILRLVFIVWLAFFIAAFFASPPAAFMTCLLTAYAFHQILKWQMALEASRRFSEDHSSGALELLLVTPLSPAKILAAQWRRQIDCFRKPMTVACLLNLGMVCLVLFSPGLKMDADDAAIFSGMFMGGILVLFVDFFTIGWIGMWLGLRGKRHHQAVLGALGRVMLPGWLGIFVIFVLGNGGAISSPEGAMTLWFIAVILAALIVGIQGKSRLTRQFRQIASGGGSRTTEPRKRFELPSFKPQPEISGAPFP